MEGRDILVGCVWNRSLFFIPESGEKFFGAVHSDILLVQPFQQISHVLAGKDKGPRFDIVCANAAPLLYVTGKAKDLKEGLEMAKGAIKDGKAVDKLRDWVTWQNEKPEDGLPTLEAMLKQL